MSLFEELKRRNVFRVGVAYIVAAWVFLQVADLVFDAINAPDWVLQSMLFLAVFGFIAAMIVAWAYEVTPEGIKREKDVVRNESITNQTAARLNKLTIGLVLAAIAVVAVDRMIPENGSTETEKGSEPFSQAISEQAAEPGDEKRALTPEEPSVAVLPFVNMSSDPEQEFFSDGISEEILNVLTRIPNLKVAARTSSFQFKGQNLDIADIAEQLKVNHILEGSVRKAGNQLRITAQLIEAESGFHMWSDTFDRQLEDVFAIQDEIAGAIAGELRARLSTDAIETSTVVDVEAYELYLKGLGLVATRKEDDLFKAFDVLKAALEIEPDYVPAMATLARGYVVAPYFTLRSTPLELREQARFWANKALQMEPDNAEALAVLGVVTNEVDRDSDQALALLRQAAAANPGSLAVNNFLGDVLFRTGHVREAIVYESKAAEIDPLAPVHLSDLGFIYIVTGDLDKAQVLAQRALEQDPAFGNAHQVQQDVYWALGDYSNLESAINAQIAAGRLNEAEEVMMQARLQYAKGNTESAHDMLLKAKEMFEARGVTTLFVAYEAVYQRDFDLAGEILQKAYAEKTGNYSFPLYIRLPEQAPDSEPWQAFWRLPEPARLAELRRANGMNPHFPAFGEAAK